MEYEIEISSHEVCEILGITRAMLSLWKGQGKGPAYQTVPTVSETSTRQRYQYRLRAVLDFMAERGATKAEIEAAQRKAITRQRQRLARKAEKMRIKAMIAIRQARDVREQAAMIGHKPSIKILERGGF